MRAIMFRNPNDDTHDRQDKFWMSFSTWYKEQDYYADQNELDRLYRLSLGKMIPFNISMDISSSWDEIVEYIGIVYEHKVPEDERDVFSAKVNEIIDSYRLAYLFQDGRFIDADNVTTVEEVKSVDHWLYNYKDAYKAYQSAMEKLSNNRDDRNALDDIRLSLESLARELTGKNYTLENQLSKHTIEGMLKQKGTSDEIKNMITKMIDCFANYQNNNVKHHDNVDADDVEVMVSIACVLMKYLIQKIG